jgi:hypothetical protein
MEYLTNLLSDNPHVRSINLSCRMLEDLTPLVPLLNQFPNLTEVFNPITLLKMFKSKLKNACKI